MTNLNVTAQNSTELDQFFDLSFDLLCIIDANGDFKRLNRAFEKTLGWPNKKLRNKPFLDCVHPDDRSPTQSAVEKLSQGRAATQFENRYRCQDGSYRWLTWNIQSGPGGTMYATARDITAPKQREAQIQETLARRIRQVETSTEVAQEIAAAPALDELFRQVVNLVKERFGYYHAHVYTIEVEDLVMQEGTGEPGRQMKASGHKIALAAEKSLVARAARTGEAVLVPDVTLTPGWLPNPLLPNTKSELAMPIKLQDQVLGVLDVQNDSVGGLSGEDQLVLAGLCGQIAVSINNRREEDKRRKAETELGKLSRAVEQSASTVVITNLEGYIEYVNPRFEETTGYTREEAIGQHTRILKSGETTGHEYKHMWETIAAGGEWRGEFHNRRKNGELYWEFASISPIRNEEGITTHFLAVKEEITERKEWEQALAKRAAQSAVLNEVNLTVLTGSDPHSVYQMVAQSLVDHFGMSFARIWLVDEVSNELVLQVSAGDYTHLTGPHGRVSLDSDKKLAWIAKGQRPHVINDLVNDPRADDKEWVIKSKNVAFAGYPLMVEDRVVGVLGMFSRTLIDEQTLSLVQPLAVLVGSITSTHRLQNQLRIRARELETVAEVSVQATTILDTTELLQAVVDLTKERFGLYHAHIYLLDDAGQMLNLTAGAGEVGRQMVAEGRQIPFEQEQSLVARAARLQQGVIANNVREAADWMPNPLLPDTCSELAVPIIVGQQLLGVLDVQADVVNHFTDEDVLAKTTLATQVAVALQNARSFEREEKAVKELNNLTRRLTQEGWEDYHRTRSGSETGYVYDLQQLLPLQSGGDSNGELPAVPSAGQPTIEQTLRVGHEPIGQLTLSEPQRLTEDVADIVNVVANRLSDHLENLRLSEQNEIALVETRRSQQMLQSVIDSMPDWIFIKDWEHRYQLVNKSFAESFNLMPEEIIGKDALELGLPEDVVKGNPDKGITGLWPQDLEAMKSGETKITASEPGEINGQQGYLNTIRVPLKDNEGKVWAILGVVRDVTERERLLADVQRLATIVENHPDFIGVGTLDGKALYVNPAGLKMMGLPDDHDVTAMDVTKFYPPKDAERLQKEGLPTALEKGFWSAEANMLRVDGTAIPVEQTISINYDTDGKPYSFSITMRDIIERKQAEREREWLLAEVQDSQKLLRSIIDATPDWIFIKDQEHCYHLVNQGYANALHMAPEDFIGKNDLELGFPEELVKGNPEKGIRGFWTDDRLVMDSGDTQVYPDDPAIIDGVVHTFHTIKTPLRHTDGQVWGVLAFARDISERKQVEVERERLLVEVEAAYRQYVRQEWEQYLGEQHQGQWEVEYLHPGLSEGLASLRSGEQGGNGAHQLPSLDMPISLRGQDIGSFILQDVDPNREWTAEELALVETVTQQLALTVENLRLFDDTQQRAAREQLTRKITDKMRGSPDVNTIIETGLTELAQALGVSRTYVKLSPGLEQDEQTNGTENP